MKFMLNVWDLIIYFSQTISAQSRRYLKLLIESNVLISETWSLATGFKLFNVKAMPLIHT